MGNMLWKSILFFTVCYFGFVVIMLKVVNVIEYKDSKKGFKEARRFVNVADEEKIKEERV